MSSNIYAASIYGGLNV